MMDEFDKILNEATMEDWGARANDVAERLHKRGLILGVNVQRSVGAQGKEMNISLDIHVSTFIAILEMLEEHLEDDA